MRAILHALGDLAICHRWTQSFDIVDGQEQRYFAKYRADVKFPQMSFSDRSYYKGVSCRFNENANQISYAGRYFDLLTTILLVIVLKT